MMKPTQAEISIFLRPNLSEIWPEKKMKAMYATKQMVVIIEALAESYLTVSIR